MLLVESLKSTTIKPDDTPMAKLLKHHLRFWGQKGSKVVFKRPKVAKQVWEVVHIELDPNRIHWTQKGETPNYIKLEATIGGKKQTIWTCENKLRPLNIIEKVKA
jgi:hypothetical protein